MTDLMAALEASLAPVKDLATIRSATRWLTVRQPWADLLIAGVKDVENRSRPVPKWAYECPRCHGRPESWRGRVSGDSPSLGYVPCPDCDDNPTAYGDPDSFWPFTLGIHAAKALDDSPGFADGMLAYGECVRRLGDVRVATESIESIAQRLGVLLGTVEVTGQHHADDCDNVDGDLVTGWPENRGDDRFCSLWAQPGMWHYQITNPTPLATPVPWKGRLGFWTIDTGGPS